MDLFEKSIKSVTFTFICHPVHLPSRRTTTGPVETHRGGQVSQSVSYFTVPPRAHPSTGSHSPAPPLPV